MKALKYMFAICALPLLFASCNQDYIDPISSVAPGEDKVPPSISISSPFDGQKIRVREDIASITVRAEASDDIEMASVSIKLDGKEISGRNTSKDYRRFVIECPYDDVRNGAHTLVVTATDKSGKSSSKTVAFEKIAPYKPIYPDMGEMFYMPFDDEALDFVSITSATAAGDGQPQYVAGKNGKALKNSEGAYLSFPTLDEANGTNLLANEFSATFRYKLNATPDRAGILTVSADDPAAAAGAKNNRTKGFRFFREAGNGGQTFKLNAGNGTADSWFDGGAKAMLDPATTGADWVFIAFTISGSECAVYINGEEASRGAFGGIDWDGCTSLSIMSGAPNFNGWNHLSDLSLMDDLRLYNKALTQAQIVKVMNE
ncbi:MAG: hypothetical protein LBD35_02635 [Prevotellaceae bacterium]|jgi:hypothetical protein|nr:hypothetical protein [Prevotellaceae bacterium]